MLSLDIKQHISLQAKASILLFCSLALMSFLPQLRALPVFNYLWPLNMFAWIFFAFLADTRFFLKSSIHRITSYLFFTYVIFICIVSGNSFLANRYLEYLQLLIFLWGFEFYFLNYDKWRINEKIIAFLSPFILVTSINTIYMYLSHPNISRTAKKDTAAGLEQMTQGVAGYDFVYFIVFVFAGLVYLAFVFDRRLILRIALLFSAGVLFVNIVLSNFMIAMLLALLVMFFRFFVYKTDKLWTSIYLVLIVVLIPTMAFLFDVIFDFLIELNKDSMNAQRLIEIKLLLESGIVEASLGARLHAFDLSWQAFSSFPWTGIIVNDLRSTSGAVIGFGQHSFLLDSFALFGFFVGGVGLYVFLAPVFRMYSQRSLINYSSFPLLLIFMVLILFVVNNITPSVGLAVFFVMPVIQNIMRRSMCSAPR